MVVLQGVLSPGLFYVNRHTAALLYLLRLSYVARSLAALPSHPVALAEHSAVLLSSAAACHCYNKHGPHAPSCSEYLHGEKCPLGWAAVNPPEVHCSRLKTRYHFCHRRPNDLSGALEILCAGAEPTKHSSHVLVPWHV